MRWCFRVHHLMYPEFILQEWRTSIQGKPCIVRPVEQTARTTKCPGCFASLHSEQGSASLALP